ncbi:MAG: hypothetical protein ACLFN1_04195 [Bacteroidales bacterium]
MLRHQKKVLSSVRHYFPLFRKELKKSLEWLNDDEIGELEEWLEINFDGKHAEIIEEVFSYQKKTF